VDFALTNASVVLGATYNAGVANVYSICDQIQNVRGSPLERKTISI